MRRSTRIDGSAGGEPLSCGNQSTYNRVANAGNLHRLSPFQMPFGILHNLTGKSSLTFSIEKCHFITAIEQDRVSEAAYLFALLKANPFSRSKWAVNFSQFQPLMYGIPLPPVDANVMHTEKLQQKIPLGTAKEETVSANEDTSPTLPSETKPSHKGGKAAIIIGCLLLIGLLSFLAMQDISEKPPATIPPSSNSKPSVTQPTAPSKIDIPTAQPTTPGQTFNYGGGSTDTGPGSGHSLREDYGDPEDLYEDGDYDDLDEAWDEWEEGW